jgi:hypothetical protein
MWIPFSTPVELDTTLSQDEVVRRLREAVVSPFAFPFYRWGSNVSGRVREDRCWLEYRTIYNNGFKRRLTLCFEASEKGTRLTGQFAPRASTLVFSAIWLSLGLFFTLMMLSQARTDGWAKASDGVYLLLGMVAVFCLLWLFGIWLSSLSETEVLEFVEELVNSSSPPVGLPSGVGWVARAKGESVPGDVLIRPRPEIPRY